MPRKGKRTDLALWIAQWMGGHQPAVVGEPEWTVLLETLAPISPSYLRKLLRESGVPLTPVVEGVRQENLPALEKSLAGLWEAYNGADIAGKREIRKRVIEAKDHARWASKTRPEKHEMVLWMLTWLENPPLFGDWVALRKAAIFDDSQSSAPLL